MLQTNFDIVRVPENLEGHDKIIGDIHGNLSCLQSAIGTLKIDDRLFIVGDLVDKGTNNLGVINEVIKHKNQLFVVRGNHEELCLQTLIALEYMAPDLRSTTNNFNELVNIFKNLFATLPPNSPHKKNIRWHLKNGGEWIIKLFLQEIMSSRILVQRSGVNYTKDSGIFTIKSYIQSLPYIIKVGGKNPFCIVHADMPLDDNALAYRVMFSGFLSQDEKDYAQWARVPGTQSQIQISPKGREPWSVAAFTGHNNVDKPQGQAYRAETNTFNLDIGAPKKNYVLIVDFTNKTYEIVGNNYPSLTEHMKRAINDISTGLYMPYLQGIQSITQGREIKDYSDRLSSAANFVNSWQKENPKCTLTNSQLIQYACVKGYLSDKQRDDLYIVLASFPDAKKKPAISWGLESDRHHKAQQAIAENLRKQKQRAEFNQILEESHRQIENTSILGWMMP